MNGKPRMLLAIALAAGLGTTGLQAQEQRSAREVRPTYSRQRSERAETPPPEPRALPESLRIAVPRTEVVEPAPRGEREGAARTRREPAEDGLRQDLVPRAHEAAGWAAAEAIERFGRPRYFEIGFYDGLHDALRRTRHDRWELEQGRRSGSFDPEALGLGDEIGTEEARRVSADEAHRLVVEQFADLGREPVRLSPPPPPPFTASGFVVAEPRLRDVFHDLSWRGHRAGGLRHLRLDPWRLYRAGRHGDFYRGDWRTGRFGFDLWRKRHGRSGWARGLSRDEWRLFEERFEIAFEAELARRFARVADRMFDRGYDGGWRYGIRIGREWQFRRGYHLGFETAVRRSASAAFHRHFRPAWVAAYDSLFREWSSTVKLEARSVWLRDGNDDGIFEPGEELFAELDLINVGGGSGRLDARLTGAVLAAAERRPVDLPRRSPVRLEAPLRGVVSPGAEPMTDSVVTVSIGELSESLPLRVSHVLRFDEEVRLAGHDALRGIARVDVRVANASNRVVLASLDAGLQRGRLREPHRELPRMLPGASRTVSFEIHDAHPLDLMGGDLVLSVASATGGRAQGRLEARLPELATDLGDRSLVDYLLRLARSPAADRAEIGRAHELMLRRLEVDWRAAVRADGNPYRRDLRGGPPSTALGELVAAVRHHRRDRLNREVLVTLVPRIDELSRSLPGTHPFLRRAMRRLGRQLL